MVVVVMMMVINTMMMVVMYVENVCWQPLFRKHPSQMVLSGTKAWYVFWGIRNHPHTRGSENAGDSSMLKTGEKHLRWGALHKAASSAATPPPKEWPVISTSGKCGDLTDVACVAGKPHCDQLLIVLKRCGDANESFDANTCSNLSWGALGWERMTWVCARAGRCPLTPTNWKFKRRSLRRDVSSTGPVTPAILPDCLVSCV